MKGGVILFRGTGTAAGRYLESDRSTADEYYLEGGTALAEFAVSGRDGEVIETRTLDPESYAAWVDWTGPITGTSMGTPRAASDRSKESPRLRCSAMRTLVLTESCGNTAEIWKERTSPSLAISAGFSRVMSRPL